MPRKKPLTRYTRDKNAPAIQITERDIEILKALARMRFLTKEQIARLLFWERGKQEKTTREAVCQRRLTLLYHNKYLNRFYIPTIPGQGGSPAVYYLGSSGRCYLAGLNIHIATINKPSQRIHMFIDHTLAVNDVWVEVEKLHRIGKWKLIHWLTPSDLYARKRRVPAAKQTEWIIPDGYFETSTNGKRRGFFVEVDRGTMPLKRFGIKILSYIDYKTSSQFKFDYGTKSMRVLTTTPSTRRRNSLVATAENLGARSVFWFVAHETLKGDGMAKALWCIASAKHKGRIIT